MFCIFFSYGVIGVTLFKSTQYALNEKDYMITGQGNANFDNLGNAMISLIQGFVGEGFYEIMFATMNENDTGWVTAFYMVTYYFIMSLLCVNLLFGLLLSIFSSLYSLKSPTPSKSSNKFIKKSINTNEEATSHGHRKVF